MAVLDLPALPPGPQGVLDIGALDLMQRPVWLFNAAGPAMLHGNDAALKLWGVPDLATFLAQGMPWASSAARDGMAATAAKSAAKVVRDQFTLQQGHRPVTVDATFSTVRLPGGGTAMLAEAQALPDAAHDHDARALEAVRQLPALVSLYDADGRALFRNPAAARAYAAGTVTFAAAFDSLAASGALWDGAWAGSPGTAELLARTAAGRRWHRVDARRAADPATGRTCLLVNEQDIEAEMAVRAEIEHRATHDALTKLANRTLFRRRLDAAAAEADRDGHPFSVLLVDLDQFKAVNDTLGHEAGDMLLREASCRMHGIVRRTDTLARLGGDEFGVLLPGLGCRAKAAEVADAMIRRIGCNYTLNGATVRIGASIGIAMHKGRRSGDGIQHADDLIRAADRALYGAKSAGRNTFRLAA